MAGYTTAFVIALCSPYATPVVGHCFWWPDLDPGRWPQVSKFAGNPDFFKAQELYGLYEARKALQNRRVAGGRGLYGRCGAGTKWHC